MFRRIMFLVFATGLVCVYIGTVLPNQVEEQISSIDLIQFESEVEQKDLRATPTQEDDEESFGEFFAELEGIVDIINDVDDSDVESYFESDSSISVETKNSMSVKLKLAGLLLREHIKDHKLAWGGSVLTLSTFIALIRRHSARS
jgi:hypothetical protein